MKTSVVPAQVTTIEDRIIGNLGFSQILLLIIPVFLSAGIFTLLPPILNGALYKYILMAILLILCIILSIRIRGKIVAFWLVVIFRYNQRPKYYIYNKNTSMLRENYTKMEIPIKKETISRSYEKQKKTVQLDISTTMKARELIENPTANTRFETDKKGALHVRFTQVSK